MTGTEDERPDNGLLAEVEQAIADGAIVPWYQPLVDLESGAVVGIETLARWILPDGTVRPSGTFIPLSEESDLIVRLDHAVISRALAEFAAWHPQHPGTALSLNLSGRHLDRPDCADWVERALAEAEVDPALVICEFTEHKPPNDLALCAATLDRLRDHGVRVWLDDFGSGWSGLQHLRELTIDGVKLDTTFTRAAASPLGEAVVRAAVDAARAFGFSVTLEGIETEAQARHAREMGCTYGQGYWWSPAVPVEELDSVLDAVSELPHLGQ